MGKIKIGVLIFTSNVKDRNLSNASFDNKKYYGLKAILAELQNDKYVVSYISEFNINNYDYVLIPIISYYDAMCYIKEIYGKKYNAKIIVGGPYVMNYHTFVNAYAVVLGRCENMIEGIFEGESFTNVIYPENLRDAYEIGEIKRFLCIGDRNENAVGCKAKCFFCQYAWKNKYKSLNENGYNSAYSQYEDYIQNLNADKNGRYVTAIDGLTEQTRLVVNKRITDEEILSKLNEIHSNDIAGMLKIYNIIAYPWESTVNFNDLINIVKKADSGRNKNKLTIYMTHTHFIPKLMTPLEDYTVNIMDARKFIINNPIPYKGKYFKLANNISVTSTCSAIEEYIVDRADDEETIFNVKKILCSNKYISLDSRTKITVCKKYFEKYITGYKGTYRLKYTHDIEKAKMVHKNRLEKLKQSFE